MKWKSMEEEKQAYMYADAYAVIQFNEKAVWSLERWIRQNRMIGFEADEDGMGQRMEVDDEGIIWESDKYVQTNER